MTVPFGVPAPLPPGDPTSNGNGPRLGARVLLLDANDRLLLLHAHDPTERDRRWWELPGGGLRPSETTAQACQRELAEETGTASASAAGTTTVESGSTWPGCPKPTHEPDSGPATPPTSGSRCWVSAGGRLRSWLWQPANGSSHPTYQSCSPESSPAASATPQ